MQRTSLSLSLTKTLSDARHVPSKDFADAVDKAEQLVAMGGIGHTSCLYTDQDNQPERVAYFGQMMKTARILINTPASQGGIGDLYNFKLAPSLTLGCGSGW